MDIYFFQRILEFRQEISRRSLCISKTIKSKKYNKDKDFY